VPPLVVRDGERYDFRIGLPADWEIDPQSGTFDPFFKNTPWSVGLDTFAAPGDNRLSFDMVVAVGAAPVPADMSLESFTKRVIRAAPCRPHVAAGDGTLGGEPSRETEFVCPNAVSWIQVTAIHDGMGYVVLLAAKYRPYISSRPITRQIVETFAFAS
jgi:hypothetical protein